MGLFSDDSFDNHKSVHFFHDMATGLHAIIAVHNTNLGPAAGGTRLWHYANDDLALTDALRLSRAMSYKNAMADIPFGGGKAVILKPKGDFDRQKLFEAYGRCIHQLGGEYNTAEDVGVNTDDMAVIRTQTPYVAGLDEGRGASGDPSPVTAKGVFNGITVAAKFALGAPSVKGLHVALQGLGHVGYNLAQRLHSAGAKLTVTDINQQAIERAKNELGANVVAPDEIYDVSADIFAPCALGSTINPDTIDRLKVSIVGGAANNQLASSDMGKELMARDILYCPDYVINAGGIINVASELLGGCDPDWVQQKVAKLSVTLNDIFERSAMLNEPTNVTADSMAQQIIFGNAVSI